MKTLTILAILLFSNAALAADSKQPNDKLCSLRTVYVEGNNRASNWVRKNIEKKTWLNNSTAKSEADAVLLIEENGAGPFTSIDMQLTRVEPEEFLLGDTASVGMWGGYPRILDKLNKAANCPKP